MVLNAVFFWCFWSKIFDREQQQQQQQEEHMTPCNLGAGGRAERREYFYIQDKHYKILYTFINIMHFEKIERQKNMYICI